MVTCVHVKAGYKVKCVYAKLSVQLPGRIIVSIVLQQNGQIVCNPQRVGMLRPKALQAALIIYSSPCTHVHISIHINIYVPVHIHVYI